MRGSEFSVEQSWFTRCTTQRLGRGPVDLRYREARSHSLMRPTALNHTKADIVDAQIPIFDLSHTIEHGMITYRGLPAPLICDFLSRQLSRQHYAEVPNFTLAALTWWRTPGRISTARSTDSRTARISRSCH